jgi:hypothetical protein
MIGAHPSKPIIMLILDDKIRRTEQVMSKLNAETEEFRRKKMEDSSLSHQLRRMNREADSVRRSGDKRKIHSFNRKYVSKMSHLATIRQTTGTMDREDAVREVKKWKEKN